MENKNIFNNILGAMEREGIKVTNDKGLEDMIVLLRRCIVIDTKTIDVFLSRMKRWLENEHGIMFRTDITESGAFTYTMTGIMDIRIHRSATIERAMAAGIIRGIEMINGSGYETKNN